MVAEHPLGSVYHHTAFGRVISTTFPHAEPYYVALIDTEGRCLGGMALFLIKSWLTGTRFVSIPWACYGDPLVSSSEELMVLIEAIEELAKQVKASYVEIRAYRATHLIAATSMVPAYRDKSHSLDLTKGLPAVWNGFHKDSIRKRIRRAERSGIEVHVATSEEEVMAFYQAFVENRRQLGLPPQKPEYFQNIWRYMGSCGLAQFWIARIGGAFAGGQCCFRHRDMIILNYIAVEESRRSDGVGQYLYWAPIRAAAENGLKTVNLGKVPAHSRGLLCHKQAWGGVEVETPVFYYPRPMGISSYESDQQLSYRAMRLFWRRVPARLSRIASQFFYRHTG